MITLTGNNLGKRQKELNTKVKEAASGKINFEEIKSRPEQSDVDKLFKIDLASKYRNVDYIIEVLKSGDNLYISRALKQAIWLYDDEYSKIINTDYLHHSIFPFMSPKIIRKTLTTISSYIRNENRAQDFYLYCLSISLYNIAFKFLIFTSDSFKLKTIQTDVFKTIANQKPGYELIKYFIGNSFPLIVALINEMKYWNKNKLLREFSYLYTVSDVQYLDVLEEYGEAAYNYFGLRISKDILKKHKDRVLKNPSFYLTKLNCKTVVRHSSCDDAKLYLCGCLPETCKGFWDMRYYSNLKHVLNIIPEGQRFEYMKDIFTAKYPGEEFEMSLNFYNSEFYGIMSTAQKEAWALRQLASQNELLGKDKDYLWYKFVGFDKAFIEIKKLVMIATDRDERHNIVKVLVESASTPRDVEKLLNYYYERHVNELPYLIEKFIDKMMECHTVLDFDESCWTIFENILYSMNVYKFTSYYSKMDHRCVVLLYYIVHKKEFPEAMVDYVDSFKNNNPFYSLKYYIKRACKDRYYDVYEFLMQFYVRKLESFDGQEYNEDVRNEARKYIEVIINVQYYFDINKIKELPEIVVKYAKLDWDKFSDSSIFKKNMETLPPKRLLHILKQDATLAVAKFPILKKEMEDSEYNISVLLKKLKIYFSNDISKEFLNFFMTLLTENRRTVIFGAVFGVMQLADVEFKSDFMTKYSPTEPKINHSKIDENVLYVQEAICRFAGYSRPPVPLSNMLLYMKGDYMQYCLPIFNMYFAHLPQPQCLTFVKSIIDTPLSLQKHGIRLAFKCYTTDNLKELLSDIWKKSKNVSLRMILYTELFNKITDKDAGVQVELFQLLNEFTADLNQNDSKDVFSLLTSSQIPEIMRGDFLAAAWKAVSNLPDKSVNWERKQSVIRCMGENMSLMNDDLVRPIVDEHIWTMLINKQILNDYPKDEIKTFNDAKWEFVAHYLVYFNNDQELERNVKILKLITDTCVQMWNEVHDDRYTYRQFLSQFIRYLECKSRNNSKANPLFESLIADLGKAFPSYITYLTLWNLRLIITIRTLVNEATIKVTQDKIDKNLAAKETAVKFGNEVGNILKDLIARERYYSSLFSEVSDLIARKVSNILYISHDLDYKNEDLNVFISVGLTNHDIAESYLLAIKMLPIDCPNKCNDDYEKIMSKIRMFNNDDVKCSMYDKFVNSDFKRRKYI